MRLKNKILLVQFKLIINVDLKITCKWKIHIFKSLIFYRVWGPRLRVSMTPSVCRTCFNTCDPDTKSAHCFTMGSTNKGIPQWKSSSESYFDPLNSKLKSDWQTDWVSVQKANKNGK